MYAVDDPNSFTPNERNEACLIIISENYNFYIWIKFILIMIDNFGWVDPHTIKCVLRFLTKSIKIIINCRPIIELMCWVFASFPITTLRYFYFVRRKFNRIWGKIFVWPKFIATKKSYLFSRSKMWYQRSLSLMQK